MIAPRRLLRALRAIDRALDRVAGHIDRGYRAAAGRRIRSVILERVAP